MLRFDPDLLGIKRSLYDVWDEEGVLMALPDCCFNGELARGELKCALENGLAMELRLGLGEEGAVVSRLRETSSGRLMEARPEKLSQLSVALSSIMGSSMDGASLLEEGKRSHDAWAAARWGRGSHEERRSSTEGLAS